MARRPYRTKRLFRSTSSPTVRGRIRRSPVYGSWTRLLFPPSERGRRKSGSISCALAVDRQGTPCLIPVPLDARDIWGTSLQDSYAAQRHEVAQDLLRIQREGGFTNLATTKLGADVPARGL